MIAVAQKIFFLRIGNKGRFDKDGRNALSLQNSKASLLNFVLVKPVDAFELVKHCCAERKAVADCPIRSHVDEDACYRLVDGGNVDAADQVGFILAFREPARRLRRGAALAESKDARAARTGFYPSIGMNADKQMRADLPCNRNPTAETHEMVGVAGHHGTHIGF